MFDTIQQLADLRASMLTKVPGKVYQSTRRSRDFHCSADGKFEPSDNFWGNKNHSNHLEAAGVFINGGTPLVDGVFGQADSMMSMADDCDGPKGIITEIH